MQWGGTRGPCTGKGHRGPCLAVGGWVGRTPPMDSGVPCASPGVTDVHPPGLMRTPSRTLRPPPQCSPTLPGPQPGDPPTASSMSAACGPWPSCDPPEIGGPNPHPPIKQVVVFLQSGEKNPNPLFFCGGGGTTAGVATNPFIPPAKLGESQGRESGGVYLLWHLWCCRVGVHRPHYAGVWGGGSVWDSLDLRRGCGPPHDHVVVLSCCRVIIPPPRRGKGTQVSGPYSPPPPQLNRSWLGAWKWPCPQSRRIRGLIRGGVPGGHWGGPKQPRPHPLFWAWVTVL